MIRVLDVYFTDKRAEIPVKRILLRVLIILLSVVAAFVAVEFYLRSTQKPNELQECCVHDATLGWRNIPEFDRNKPIGSGVTTFFLGDSVMYGIKLKLRDSIPAKMWRITRNIKAYNFGVPGYGTDQEFLQYQSIPKGLQPKIVIIGVSLCNDVGNVANSTQYGASKPRFQIVNGELIGSFNESLLNRYRSTFAIADLLLRVQAANTNTEALLNRFSIDIKDKKFNQALVVTMVLLHQLVSEIKADGAKPIIVLFPYKKMYLDSTHVNHPLRTEALRMKEISVIDLYPKISKKMFADRYHFNERGAQVAAEAISKEL